MSAGTARWWTSLGLLGVAGGGLPLVFHLGMLEAFEQPKVLLLRSLAIGLAALGLGALATRRAPSAPLDLPSLAVLAFVASAFASALLGVSPATSLSGAHRSWAGVTTFASYAVLFFAARSVVRDARAARLLLWGPALAAPVAGLHAVLQFAGHDPVGLGLEAHARAVGPLGNANYLGGYLAVALPACVGQACWAHARGARVLAAALAAGALLAAGGLALSFSRGPILAALLGGAGLLLGWWRVGERRAVRGVALAVGLGLVLGLAVAAGTGVLGPALERAATRLTRPLDAEVRPHLWRAAWAVFRAHPLAGVGPDALGLVFPSYAPPEAWRIEPDRIATRAHHELLHVAATQGLLGLAALALGAFGLVRSGRRAIQRATAPADRALVVTLGASLLAFAVHALVGFTVAAIGALVAIQAGAVAGLARRPAGVRELETGPRRARRVLTLASAGTMALALLPLVVRPVLASVHARRGQDLVAAGRPLDAIEHLERALAQQPRDPFLLSLPGAAWYDVAIAEPDRAHKLRAYHSAVSAYQRYLDREPADVYARHNLARLETELAVLEPTP